MQLREGCRRHPGDGRASPCRNEWAPPAEATPPNRAPWMRCRKRHGRPVAPGSAPRSGWMLPIPPFNSNAGRARSQPQRPSIRPTEGQGARRATATLRATAGPPQPQRAARGPALPLPQSRPLHTSRDQVHNLHTPPSTRPPGRSGRDARIADRGPPLPAPGHRAVPRPGGRRLRDGALRCPRRPDLEGAGGAIRTLKSLPSKLRQATRFHHDRKLA